MKSLIIAERTKQLKQECEETIIKFLLRLQDVIVNFNVMDKKKCLLKWN